MSPQLIISLGREFGSGGHEIARILAQRFHLPLYDKNILEQAAKSQGMDPEILGPYDESPKNRLIYRTVNGFSNAPGDAVAQLQFRYLKERAQSGESFVVLGRCAEEVLCEFPGLVSLFVLSDREFKVTRTLARGAATHEEALFLMDRMDWKRRTYHNQFARGKWGDSRTYDLTINSARLGIHGTADFLEAYIRARMEQFSST